MFGSIVPLHLMHFGVGCEPARWQPRAFAPPTSPKSVIRCVRKDPHLREGTRAISAIVGGRIAAVNQVFPVDLAGPGPITAGAAGLSAAQTLTPSPAFP